MLLAYSLPWQCRSSYIPKVPVFKEYLSSDTTCRVIPWTLAGSGIIREAGEGRCEGEVLKDLKGIERWSVHFTKDVAE